MYPNSILHVSLCLLHTCLVLMGICNFIFSSKCVFVFCFFFIFFSGRQDTRAASRRRSRPSTDDRGGGHEGLSGVVSGGEEAEGDKRGARSLLHHGG